METSSEKEQIEISIDILYETKMDNQTIDIKKKNAVKEL